MILWPYGHVITHVVDRLALCVHIYHIHAPCNSAMQPEPQGVVLFCGPRILFPSDNFLFFSGIKLERYRENKHDCYTQHYIQNNTKVFIRICWSWPSNKQDHESHVRVCTLRHHRKCKLNNLKQIPSLLDQMTVCERN